VSKVRLPALAVLAWLGVVASASQGPTLKITTPVADSVVSGPTGLAAVVVPYDDVELVSFFVNGRLICEVERPPYQCGWNPGHAIRGYHVRVVATLTRSRRLVANLHTKDLGYVEQVRADAVLVPVIVTRRGEFVRGLTKQDFQVFENGVPQAIAAMGSEDVPLELVLAVDISSSMEHALDDVRPAVKQLLSKLRPDDAATLIGFNDTMFVVAERETDPGVREAAVDLLSPWGGTALYDATVRSLDLVTESWGRKGVIVFSDGDDRHSLTTRDAAMARVEASDAMLYTVGFGAGATIPALRSSLEGYARSTGGRAFFPREAKDLDAVFEQIVAELANQYVLSYSSTNPERDNSWREIRVRVRSGEYDIRARRGYRAVGSAQRVGR
jgi:Ca-activated chloride channel homolog